MALYASLLLFGIIWAKGDNKKEWTKRKKFWDDQRDEMLAVALFSMGFIIFDDEMLKAVLWSHEVIVLDWKIPPPDWEPGMEELQPFMYLVIPFVGYFLYKKTFGKD